MNTVSQTTRGHSIVPKFAANLTMLFNELSFFDRFAAAKATGFTGVEYLFPFDFEKAVLGELLQQYGLTQVLHNLPAGNWGAGERGIAILPDRVAEFRDGVRQSIDYAKALDCGQLNCLVERFRIIDGLPDAIAEFRHAVGQNRDSTFARPPISSGQIMQH